jgi:MULE transposase domain
MESIEEQWNPPGPQDIMSDLWMNIKDAKQAVKIWLLDRGESWSNSSQNNKARLQLHCILPTCSFYIRVAQKKDFFGVTSYTSHNCPPSTHTRFKPRHSAWYLAHLIERDVNVNRHIKPKEVRERAGLYHELQNIPYMPAWRAIERLRGIIDGDEGTSFSLFPDWIDRIKKADKRTYIRLKTTKDDRFEALFVMLGSIRSRIDCLRPFYALDGTHTRSQYNLTLLIAVGIDAEDRILPFAWALVPCENKIWWTWFCEHLFEAFDGSFQPDTVIISDRDKGLLDAVESKLPGTYHAMCCQHITENIHKKFGRQYKAPFWRIARAGSQEAFDIAVQALQNEAPKVEEYISSIGYESFAFARFPRPRFGHDTSNIVESINSVWREIRELPPLQLLNGIYQWCLTTWYQRYQLRPVPGNSVLSNAAYKAYKHRESAARSFQVLPSSDTVFLVTTTRGSQYIVNLPLITPEVRRQGHCECQKYDDFTAPCVHAIACILYLSRDPFPYFSPRYDWDISLRTYKHPIQPVTIQGLQVSDNLRPPIKRVKRGRPRIARIRATHNQEERRQYTCSVCRQSGHNRRVCPNQPVEHGRAQRARDQLVEGEYNLIFMYKAENNRQ